MPSRPRPGDLRPIRGLLAGLILIVGIVAIGVATDRPISTAPEVAVSAAITKSVLVCPQVKGQGSFIASEVTVADTGSQPSGTKLQVSPVRDAGSKLQTLPQHSLYAVNYKGYAGAYQIVATGPDAADVSGEQSSLINHGYARGLTAASCEAPRPDWWFVGLDGRVGYNDSLELANPTGAAATARITVLSSKLHVQTAPDLASVSVPPHSALTMQLGKIAPDVPMATVHVHVSQGQIVAAANDARINGTTPMGNDWLPASAAPAKSVVIAGMANGGGPRQLFVTDTSKQAATVMLKVVGASGTFAPNGKAQFNVPAGTSTEIDLTSALQAVSGTLLLKSDQPIVASGLSIATEKGELSDLSWRGQSRPLAVGAVFPQDFTGSHRSNRLLISATQGAATVTIRDSAGAQTQLTIPAGVTETYLIDTLLHAKFPGLGALEIVGVSGPGVYGVLSVALSGAHGPLITAVEPTFPIQPVRVPAITIDPGAGVKP